MRPRRPLATPIALLAVAGALGCRDAPRGSHDTRAAIDASAEAAGRPSATPAPAASDRSQADLSDAGSSGTWPRYFTLRPRADDEPRALEATYDALPSAPVDLRDDAVVLCRVAVVEPAPRPRSAWDRANGRDAHIHKRQSCAAEYRTHRRGLEVVWIGMLLITIASATSSAAVRTSQSSRTSITRNRSPRASRTARSRGVIVRSVSADARAGVPPPPPQKAA